MNSHIIERIFWRCKKNFFFEGGGVYFDEVPKEIQTVVENHLLHDEIPVVAVFNADLWTVITNISIISAVDSTITKIPHSEINHTASIDRVEGCANKIELLENTTTILVGENRIPIWSPGGKLCTSLMNLIMMFPLNGGGSP